MIKITDKIKITDFAKRHFDPKSGGTKITNKTPLEFEEYLNLRVADQFSYNNANQSYKVKIMDGYAPFCKLIAIENFTNARVGSMKIDISNYQYIRHGYSARTEKELPILTRWFELPVAAPVADFLIVVVYSKEQIDKEGRATEGEHDNPDEKYIPFDADWGVVAILGQTHDNEEPMQPITMMRNALGVEEGGSGHPINREQYTASVEFWKYNAVVKS